MSRLEFACRDFEFDCAAVRLVFPPQELCTGRRFLLWAGETFAYASIFVPARQRGDDRLGIDASISRARL